MPLTPPVPDNQTAILHAAIVNHSGYGIIATDASGVITVFNTAAQTMLGYSEAELIGKATPTVFHLPSEVAVRAAQFSSELQQSVAPGFDVLVAKTKLGLPNEHEWTFVRRDGSRFPVLLCVTALQDERGHAVGFLGMAVDITERRRNEQLLAEREAQYRVLFQDNPNPMLLYDTESVHILAINAAAVQLYGYPETQLVNQHLNILLPAFEHARLQEILALSSSSLRRHRWHHQRKDGGLFMVDTVSKPAQLGKLRARIVLISESTDCATVEMQAQAADPSRLQQGQILVQPMPAPYVEKRATDFLPHNLAQRFAAAAQRQTLTALQESESRLVQVLHGNPVPTFVIDDQHHVVIWNPACERILGVSAKDMLGQKDVWRVFYPQPRPVMANLIVDGGDQIELVGYYGEACKRSDVNPDAFESVDFFQHMAGGAGRWLHFCATPLRDGKGKVVGAIETLMDITEQKRAEERANRLNEDLEVRVLERTTQLAHANEELRTAMGQLVQAEKLASLGRLVAGVAHELNTPIGNMVMVASTLSELSGRFVRSVADGSITRSAMAQFLEQNQDGTQLLLSNAKRSAELIQNFKQVAVDQTTDQVREFDLAEQICDVLSVMAHVLKPPIALLQELQPGIAMHTYPGPLGQVITNLVLNAMLHGFDQDQPGTIRVVCERIGEQAHITVQDNGQGIPAENIGKIFDPFFTTKLGQGGTGLGLHISHNIVHGPLGGRMGVHSTPGMGTTFTLVLPCTATGATHRP
ncbi:MAG: PAS domain S-box protein [Pseudomonadota bacterium]